MEITCKKCGYSWETKSKMILISCPSCATKNRNLSVPAPDDKVEGGE